MKISLVVAMADNRVIGEDNKMPWHLPDELQYFKKITLGKPIVMGRNTFESIGRPLPGRKNIVLSRTSESRETHDGQVLWVNGPQQAIAAAGPVEEVMVIGGGKIYEKFLPLADRLYVTKIDLNVDGDTFFPDYEEVADWQEIERQDFAANERNSNDFTTLIFDRKR
ncbi:type 3 dihydrofolate reductase [Idiomarina piscisalsi]|uniref:Dihydrofolate reductase n=1 Tax=Idiomarina piscisalsi TaxID=1096243 RepID=A0A432YU31_9GAMM|nr:type 3 dihydrofolate reductase [Idiomarina piscisalsi]RUO66827.1 type 3 dihydrofolate reductase [Idiomarina piscisalsi]